MTWRCDSSGKKCRNEMASKLRYYVHATILFNLYFRILDMCTIFLFKNEDTVYSLLENRQTIMKAIIFILFSWRMIIKPVGVPFWAA
jgi:hypothetical protein